MRSTRAQTSRRWRRGIAWIIGVVAFAAASTYVVGGREFVRQLMQRGRAVRSQAAAALQPPTPSDIQRATTLDTASALPTGRGPAVSVGFVASWIGSVLAIAVAMFYVTGRAPRKRRRD